MIIKRGIFKSDCIYLSRFELFLLFIGKVLSGSGTVVSCYKFGRSNK